MNKKDNQKIDGVKKMIVWQTAMILWCTGLLILAGIILIKLV